MCMSYTLHADADAGAGRQPSAGCWGLADEEEGKRREMRDSTPERRPSRPPAIKSPTYARRGRSGTKRVPATALGRWVAWRGKKNFRARGAGD